MKQEKVFKNTFAPACADDELTVDGIITIMRFGALRYERLPPEVRSAVDEEMERLLSRPAGPDGGDGWKLGMLDLEVRSARRASPTRSRTDLEKHPSAPWPTPDAFGESFQKCKKPAPYDTKRTLGVTGKPGKARV